MIAWKQEEGEKGKKQQRKDTYLTKMIEDPKGVPGSIKSRSFPLFGSQTERYCCLVVVPICIPKVGNSAQQIAILSEAVL